jgi:prophage regulatory protein
MQQYRALLRIFEVLEIVGFSKSTLNNRVKNGTFPAPVKLSARLIAWRTEEVLAWVEGLKKVGAL